MARNVANDNTPGYGKGFMDDRRYVFRQIMRFLVAGLSFIAIVTMLTAKLLNGARARAEAEKAALSLVIPKQHR